MAYSLVLPSNTWVSVDDTFNGYSFTLTYATNERTGGRYVTLHGPDGYIFREEKLVQGRILQSSADDPYFTGSLACIRMSNTTEDIGLHNIGPDLDYELIYFSKEEMEG